MADIDNRMCITMAELNNLTEWLTRLNSQVSTIELRRGMEPGVGPAITAYVELHDDEGYFKLLTPAYTVNLPQVEAVLKDFINSDSSKTNLKATAADKAA
jgi:hypothetical protein